MERKNSSILSISTYTVTANLGNNIDLHLLSRFMPIYKSSSMNVNDKDGCIIGINNYTEHEYTDIPRGCIRLKKKYPKTLFNNQLTLLYKYYGFKEINIKIFSNGKIHFTGIKDYDWEVKHAGNYIINNLFYKLKYKIYTNYDDLKKLKNLNYVLYYDADKEKIVYYRNNIELYNLQLYIETPLNNIEEEESKKKIKWLNNIEIKRIVDKYMKYRNKILNNLESIKDKIMLNDNYSFNDRNDLYRKLSFYNNLKKFNKNMINNDNDILKQYLFEHIKELISIVTKYGIRLENTVYTDNYIISKIESVYPNIYNELKEIKNKNITDKSIIKDMKMNNINYSLSNICIELIKSEFNSGYGHNLHLISNLLSSQRYNIFNTYNPNDGHAGILISFYYNEKYIDQLNNSDLKPGLCHCEKGPNGNDYCRKKKKNSDKCTCLTIVMFRPGSITITGAKTHKQLEFVYNFINKFLDDNLNTVCYNIMNDEIKINKKKKIIKKQPMYIKKSSIIY